ncbi:hypothetical protein LY71_1113 [Geodermatophilus tzadiensis]|uniref:Uncharacterized protein n=1 Tax=Geodermatophilus tzadiensis TaxID=1137988 RepID=A0A2T0TQ18_9ACTN|nr:hypothetical protein [Geodermatophilus tzadiensis]PRY47824.1 hypothetical protein LY71_1113 [Geodermatophilus tzadiensis]
MSTPDPDDQRHGMTPRPKRGRALLLATFLGVIVFVFLFITLVSQCGTGEDTAQGPSSVVEHQVPSAVGV